MGGVDGYAECGSAAVSERSERTAQDYKRFRCRACGKQFNERSGAVLNRTQHPSDVIALVVLWRLRYTLALRDLPEMFAARGMVFSYEAVRDWEAKLTPALAEDLRRRRHGKVGCSWSVDETYLKVHGRWCYLYRAIDRSGALVDVMFSEHRDMAAARAFFRSAKATTGVTPDRVTTDGHDSYPRAIRTELPGGATPDQCLLEQQARTGPPRHQRPLPSHARVQVPEISRPVLPGLRRSPQLSSPPHPPPSTRSRRSPQTPVPPSHNDRAGHPGNRVTRHCRASKSAGYACWREP